MLTALLIITPLIAAFAVLLVGNKQARNIAYSAAALEFGLTMAAYGKFYAGGNPSINLPWIKSLGINFNVGLDGMSLLMVILTNLLIPIIILTTYKREIASPKYFFFNILLMQTGLVGVFMALDGFLFYVCWELALIPIYFICLLWGGDNSGKVTFKFFVYTLLGSLFMLLALIFIYLKTPQHTFDIDTLYTTARNLNSTQQGYIFWALFLAFAIKMPVFPFHTWQPDTYVTAPTQGTMLLSGIMLKMGTYGVIRWLIPMVPQGVINWGSTAIVLSIISVVYASCIAIAQKDFKRLIAYSSIAHVGLISAGIFTFNTQGVQGALVQMLAHGINVVGLFFIADIVFDRTKTNKLEELGGIRNINPLFATLALIILLGSVAMPLSNGFIGEFLLINSIYQYDVIAAVFAGLTVILGAVYMLRSYQAVMLGEANKKTTSFGQLHTSEKIVLSIICILIIILGIYPKPIFDLINPTVTHLIESVNAATIK